MTLYKAIVVISSMNTAVVIIFEVTSEFDGIIAVIFFVDTIYGAIAESSALMYDAIFVVGFDFAMEFTILVEGVFFNISVIVV
jgi:hypothetical protein